MVQVPNVASVTVVPDTVHTDPVRLLNVTGSPDVAVADTITVPADSAVSDVGVNVIVWPVASIRPEPSLATPDPVSVRAVGPLRGDELAASRGVSAPVVGRGRPSAAAFDGRVVGRSDRFPAAVGDALVARAPLGVRVFLALADFDFAPTACVPVDAAARDGRCPAASTSAAAAGTAIRPDPAENRTSIPSPAANLRARVDDLRR
jgi:hypothetical protein